MGVEVAPMTAEHVAAAGALVARRHAAARSTWPLLPVGPTDPDVASHLVSGLLTFCRGVVAVAGDGSLAGFLTGFEQTPDPASPMARYLPARAAVHLVHGHAVDPDREPTPIVAALFAALAAADVDAGIVDHVTHVPIGAAESPWHDLGFGRANTVAIRDLRPTGRPRPTDVVVRIATADDLDVVERLVDEEAVFHAASPIFRPYVAARTAAGTRGAIADELARDDAAFLVARHAGEDVGVLSIGPGLGSPLYVPDGGAYIAATAVVPAARGTGVGAALADAAFDWARDHGHRAACLHHATANRTSTSFWTGIGFAPVMVHLRRRLDDRILTDRPGR